VRQFSKVSDLNGPITRAAQEGKNEVGTGISTNSIAGLQDMDTRNEPPSPLVSILCGVLGAVLVVFLVILITMKMRCGRRGGRTWHRKDCSNSESSFEVSSTSPDLLVKNVTPGCEYEIQSIFPSAKSLTVSSTLPRSLNRSSHLSLNSLVTLQGLPPPPARPPPVERLMSPDLETLLPPPSQFHTLPRPQRSGPATPNTSTRSRAESHHSNAGSVSSVERLRRSNSHVESIV